MDINALVISGSDPGAVPGDSTKSRSFGGSRGRNRIDERLKGLALFRRDTTVSVQTVQLQMTIVLQWRWLRKQPELLKLQALSPSRVRRGYGGSWQQNTSTFHTLIALPYPPGRLLSFKANRQGMIRLASVPRAALKDIGLTDRALLMPVNHHCFQG